MVAWSNLVLLRTFFSLESPSGVILEPGVGEDIDVVGLSRRDVDVSCLDSPPTSPPVCTTKGAPGDERTAGMGVFGGFFFLWDLGFSFGVVALGDLSGCLALLVVLGDLSPDYFELLLGVLSPASFGDLSPERFEELLLWGSIRVSIFRLALSAFFFC